MSNRIETVLGVVKELGGAETVAGMFGVVTNAVYNWTAKNRLPPRTYIAIRDALAERGLVAPDHLWAMAEPKTPADVEPPQSVAAA